ncbi:MAG: NAD(P)-binding domain-containing protein, partial [Nitrospinota bacterium]
PMATIGILGTGRMGTRLAKEFADSGHQVILGSRDLERSKSIVQSLSKGEITAGTYHDAVQADWVLPAIFLRDGLLQVLEPYREFLKGKLFIDISNPFNDDYSDFILPWDNSSAEEIQKSFPESRILGAFKNVWWEVFDAPHFENGIKSDVYVVSDKEDAKNEFLEGMSHSNFRFLDSGPLKNARTIERMTLMSGELGQRYGFFPRMNYKLLGEKNFQQNVASQTIA